MDPNLNMFADVYDPSGALLLYPHSAGRRFPELAADNALRNAEPRSATNRVAIVPLDGLLTRRGNRGTATERFIETMTALAADPRVDSILLDIDSPGGSTVGTPEAGEVVRIAAERKPVIAHTGDLMASAAYWIGSQASQVVASPSAWVGGIGVYVVHADFSRALEAEGVTVSFIYAGKFKTEGNPFEPLAQDARDYFQTVVDSTYRQFTSTVARGRGVTPDVVRASFGEGRVLRAEDARAAGMVDRVETFGATLDRMATPGRLRLRQRVQAATEAALAVGGNPKDFC